MGKRQSSKTRAFGSSSRENHDSSSFYSGKLYSDGNSSSAQSESNEVSAAAVPRSLLDQVVVASSEAMEGLPESSVHLMVTSPPYNVGKDYDQDLTLDDYLSLLKRVFSEVNRVLVPGGRACVNVANLGRKPYIPLNAHISRLMLDLGFLMRGEIIWDKAASAGSSTAWGSWKSPSNPTLRDVHEYILVFSKGSFSRSAEGKTASITRDEFLEFTKSIWSFPTESASKVQHPAPFPVALPYRLIQLFTFVEDVILDPFLGSGTTAVAAIQTGRHFVGYEIDEGYAQTAIARVEKARSEAAQIPLFSSRSV